MANWKKCRGKLGVLAPLLGTWRAEADSPRGRFTCTRRSPPFWETAMALCVEAHMPAGLARMVYWPDDADGFFCAVESKTQKGWNRFQLHHYHPHASG